MGEWIQTIVVAVCALLGTYLANRKAQAIMEYKIEQLEKKVDKHNSVIERTYELEKDNARQDEQLKTLFNEVNNLKSEH